MGSGSSKQSVPKENAPKKRATRKKAKAENTTNINTNTLDEENTNEKKNIQGSPEIQLKRIQELVCETSKDYEGMSKEDVVKLLGKVKRLSALKKGNA